MDNLLRRLLNRSQTNGTLRTTAITD